MFKKLKQKIQEESGSSPDREGSFNHGPGLASPLTKDAPGTLFSGRRDSPQKDGGRRDSVDSTASTDDSTRSKEEVLALLIKRTDQVKRLETKVSELAAMIKERNRNIEKLESTLEKSEDESVQKMQELRDQLTASNTAAVREKEEELISYYSRLEKTNESLGKQLKEMEEYKSRFFKQAEEGEELHGLNTQELAKIKHMLLNVQDDLSKRNQEYEEKSSELDVAQKQVKELENEVMQFTQKLLEQKSESETLASYLNEEKRKNDEILQEKATLKSQVVTLNQQHTQTASRLSSLQASYQQVHDDHMVLQRSSDLHRQKMSSLLGEKDEQISQLQERVETLQQRLQDNTLGGDERFQAMEAERTVMEKRLQEARQQLTEVKTTWSDKITLLEKQISNLNEKITEDAEDLKMKEQELTECRVSLETRINAAKEPIEKKVEELEATLQTTRSNLSKTEQSLARKEMLLLEQKQNMESEIIKCKQRSSDMELELRDTIRDLEAKVISLEKAREKDRQTSQQKITVLERNHDDWLEKEIDTERQVTELEEQLQKYKTESSHRERDNARLQQQLQDRTQEIQTFKEKIKGLERGLAASQATVEQLKKDLQIIGADFQKATKEKDDLMLRNAQLFQSSEAQKRSNIEEREGYIQEIKSKDTAIAGLEQSLQDMTADLATKQQRIGELQTEVESAQKEFESAQVQRLKKEMLGIEEQLTDKNKTIKIQQQRLIDLKKTLQRELKVQALPNDDPIVDYYNREAPQLEVLSSTSSSVSSKQITAMFQSHQGNGNLRRGIKVPAGAERTMTMMTKCSSGNDCLCEHVNFEYLKHVLIKFMTSREHEALHLIRAVAVLLHLSQDEQRVIKDTLEWKMSWGFASRPKLGKGQMAKVIPPSH